MLDVKKELLALSDFAWQRLRKRLEGLSDEEFLWEPAPLSWTVRANDDGSVRSDWGLLFTEDPPLTTISWRISHILEVLKGPRWAQLLGLEPDPSTAERWLPVRAADAVDQLERAYALWRGYVVETDDARLGDELGPLGGEYANENRLAMILHVLDELIHHAAEVATLRDVYRATRPQDDAVLALLRGETGDAVTADRVRAERPDLMVFAAATGRWDAVPLLLELGFPISRADGRSALHHAAADGRLDLVRRLVEAGADTTATDPTYHATPLGWAEYFGRTPVVDYLSAPATSSASS